MTNDFKSAFEKAGIKTEGGMRKKCKECGKEFTPREQHHSVCPDCNKERHSGGAGGGGTSLPSDYLERGYFDEKGYLRESIYKDDAKKVADVLSSCMSVTSLRAFFNKVRAIENIYKQSNNFDQIKPKLYAFERDATYQVSRGVVSDEFRKFIVKNARLAQSRPEAFKGFVEHFMSVLAYFKERKLR